MARRNQLIQALEFFKIPEMDIQNRMYCLQARPVEELAYMPVHRILFSTSTQNSIFHTDNPIASTALKERLLSVGRKSKVTEMQGNIDQRISNGDD
jgi:hypothetical protein